MTGPEGRGRPASDTSTPGDLELVRIDGDHWLIRDLGFPTTDARRVVACIEESEDAMDVVWVVTGVPLPTRYRTAQDTLEDLVRWRSRARRDTRPDDIASFRPPTARGGRT